MIPYFVVYGAARTGTDMLCTALNRHPDIQCFLEIFNRECFPLTRGNAENTLRVVWDMVKEPVWGFKVLHYQGRGKYKDFWNFTTGTKGILIRRENLLARFVSEQIARKDRRWNTDNEKEAERLRNDESRRVAVNIPQFLESAKRLTKESDEARERFDKWIEITYEELIDDYDGNMKRILRFLEVDDTTIPQPIKYKVGRPLHKAITNYMQVWWALRGTGYEKFLDD